MAISDSVQFQGKGKKLCPQCLNAHHFGMLLFFFLTVVAVEGQ
jgi:hypothetical protein